MAKTALTTDVHQSLQSTEVCALSTKKKKFNNPCLHTYITVQSCNPTNAHILKKQKVMVMLRIISPALQMAPTQLNNRRCIAHYHRSRSLVLHVPALRRRNAGTCKTRLASKADYIGQHQPIYELHQHRHAHMISCSYDIRVLFFRAISQLQTFV